MATAAAPASEKFLVGVYDDDMKLMDACKALRNKKIPIQNVYTPFPVHGLEHVLGLRESRLPTVAFIGGAMGTTLALTMQIGMYFYDWQINVASKPLIPLPSFIPITFELTVLLASLSMVGAYLVVNKLWPGRRAKILDPRQTDDLFFIAIDPSEDEEANAEVRDTYTATGAIEIREQGYITV